MRTVRNSWPIGSLSHFYTQGISVSGVGWAPWPGTQGPSIIHPQTTTVPTTSFSCTFVLVVLSVSPFPSCCCCSVVSNSLRPHGLCSPSGSSVHGISQARIQEWVAISFSKGPSQPRNQTHISSIGRQVLYQWATRKALISLKHILWFYFRFCHQLSSQAVFKT